jgi:hypothetical protein
MIAMPGALTNDNRLRLAARVMAGIERAALASLVVLSACTPPAAVSSFVADGDYKGSSTRYQVLLRTCPRPQLLTMHVQAGITYYPWINQYIPVSVQSNGTVSGALPGVQLTGTSDGTTIRGNVTDGQCGLHFTVRKIGT